MRVSKQNLNRSLKKEIENTFIQLIADLNNESKVKEFMGDFLTPAEMETFAKRLAIAYWLKKGRSYANIRENLKVSSATIATVQNMMVNTGFQKGLKEVEADEWANLWEQKIKKFVGK